MENKDLKNIFRQELIDYEVSIDKDALWAGIQSKQKKKRFGFIFWFGIGSLAVALGLGLWSSYGKSYPDMDTINTVPKQIKIEESKIAESVVGINESSKQINDQVNILPTSVKSDNEKSTPIEKNLNRVNEIHQGENVIASRSLKEAVNRMPSAKINVAQNVNIKVVTKDAEEINNELMEATKEESSKAINKLNVKEEDDVLTRFFDEDLVDKNELIAEESDENIEDSTELLTEEPEEDENNKVVISPKKPIRFEVIPQFEYGVPIKTLVARNEMQKDLSALRNQIENPLENWSVGLSLQVNHKTGLYIGAGLRFDQLQEKVEFTEILQEDPVLLNDVILKKITFADGSVSDVTGNATGTSTLSNVYNVYNTYRRWSLPLSLGYEKNWKNWALDGGVNLIFNVSHSFDGYILDYDAADENYILVEDADIFRSRFDMDTRLNFGVTYKFSKFKIRLSPFVQLNESQILNVDSELSQAYRYYGISLGLRL